MPYPKAMHTQSCAWPRTAGGSGWKAARSATQQWKGPALVLAECVSFHGTMGCAALRVAVADQIDWYERAGQILVY